MPVNQSQDVEISAEPVDDLDAALSSLQASINTSQDSGEEATTTDPESQDDEEADDVQPEDQDPEEPVPGEPVEAEPDDEGDSSDPEEPKLTRRQRAKLYEKFKDQADRDRAENDALKSKIEELEAEDAKRTETINKALGSNADYQKALEDMTSSDPKVSDPAKKRFKVYTANREFYGQLIKGAERDVNTRLAREYWDAAEARPGIDKKLIQSEPMHKVMLHFYDQGAAHAEAAADEKLAAKDKTIETLRGEVKELRSKGVTTKVSPARGGKPATTDRTSLRGALGDDGLPTDEAISAGRNGKLDFLKF